MDEVAKIHRDQLSRIKQSVTNSHLYFQPNIKRWNEFRKFVFHRQITDEEEALLLTLKKPVIEFNILETYISRLCGEWSKQEPSIYVTPDDGAPVDPATLEVIEGHLRHALFEANTNNYEYEVYKDLLSGGFSVIKIWTEYATPMSFNQIIKFGRVFDPTLCGFDPLARYAHKGDGRYCFEFYPKSKEDFQREFPNVDIKGFSYLRTDNDFNWSYKNQKEDIIIICDYYEKKKKKKKIVQLADKSVMTVGQYEKFIEDWKLKGIIAQPPAIVGKPRTTEIETICRYRICENEVLEYIETDFKYLPLIFVDGNSIVLRDADSQAVQQMTRPYVYHTKGAQKLKNFAGQTLGAELENMVMHKFKVAKESIPDEEEYLEAYGNMQVASTYVYNAFMDNDINKPVPPPQEIQRIPAPPEVTNTFNMMDQMTQTILGSYDAALGINNNQLSGVAIVEGATQSNSAAMPYVVGFMQSLNQLGKTYLSLLPYYYKTPRSIPIRTKDGKRSYKEINNPYDPKGIKFNFDENALNVKVETGPSFSVQKSRALQQIIALQQASPLFAQFMSVKGLPYLLKNMEFIGSEALAKDAEDWMKQMQAEQQKAQQQPNPEVMKMEIEQQKLQQQAQDSQNELKMHEDQIQLDYLRLKQAEDKQRNDLERTKIDAHVNLDKIHTEKVIKSMDAAHKFHDLKHKREMDITDRILNSQQHHKKESEHNTEQKKEIEHQ